MPTYLQSTCYVPAEFTVTSNCQFIKAQHMQCCVEVLYSMLLLLIKCVFNYVEDFVHKKKLTWIYITFELS